MWYDYYCSSCGLTEEKQHGMLESPKFLCSKCGEKMKREITGGIGIHFKGIGWATKGTATDPKPKHYKVHELHGPKFLSKAIRNR